VARYDPPCRLAGVALDELGAVRVITPNILCAVERSGDALILYRTPAS